MGVPTSVVGYTSAMPRREDHKVHQDMWGHWGEKSLVLPGIMGTIIKINLGNNEIESDINTNYV